MSKNDSRVAPASPASLNSLSGVAIRSKLLARALTTTIPQVLPEVQDPRAKALLEGLVAEARGILSTWDEQ